MKLFKLSVLTLLFLFINSVSASTIIDSFNDTSPQSVYNLPNLGLSSLSNTTATTNALGGWRKLELSTNNGSDGASLNVTGGQLSLNAGSNTSATGTVTWDKNGAGLNADLLVSDTLGFTGSSCYECFVLDVFKIDQGNVDLTIQLFDGSNTTSYTSSGIGTGIQEILFSNFTGINLNSIDSISLIIAGDQASDMTLNFQGYTGKQVSSVPLPATVWLFATGLISFLGTHRKKLS